MPIELINNVEKAPTAIGPYSQAVRAGDFLFLSGQIPIDPATGEVNLFVGDAGDQAKLVLRNLRAILEAQHLTIRNVVKTTIYLDSMTNFEKVNHVYATFFSEHKPARATVEVARLPKSVAVEIDAIAYYGEKPNGK